MKIYFTASSAFKKEYREEYTRIVDFLKKKKHEVYEKIMAENLPKITSVSANEIKEWQKEWAAYVHECDCVIVEGSYPSTIHIGFETGMILSRGKPLILLYKLGLDPVFINNNYSGKLIKSEYDENNLEEVLEWCLTESKHLINHRFTFFISPEMEVYLEQVAEKKCISKSEHLRMLIENDKNLHK